MYTKTVADKRDHYGNTKQGGRYEIIWREEKEGKL